MIKNKIKKNSYHAQHIKIVASNKELNVRIDILASIVFTYGRMQIILRTNIALDGTQ